jgi:tight adherence protein B
MSTLLLVCAGLVVGVGLRLLLPLQKVAEFHPVAQSRTGNNTKHRATRHKPNEINDAIASWTEHLRDSLGAAGGLESAIMSSGELAPRVIRAEVERLAADTKYLGAESALLCFANSLNTSQGDLVIAALITATRFQSRDLVGLLTQLADCAREESKMNLRIWVSRARIRSSVRIVISSVGLFIGGLVVFNRSYLIPFTTPDGIAVLSVLLCLFSVAIWLLTRMTRVAPPIRFVARGRVDEAAA